MTLLLPLLFSLPLAHANAPSLLGDWETPCTPLPARHSVIVHLHFSDDGLFQATSRQFEDDACVTLNLAIDYEGSYAAGAPFGEGRTFDVVPSEVAMTLMSDGAVAYYVAHRECGISDWALAELRDVSGKFCSPIQMPTVGQSYADLYAIGPEGLRFGAFPAVPSDPASRPSTVSAQLTFQPDPLSSLR